MKQPLTFEPARAHRKALLEAGIPVMAFTTDDLARDDARLTTLSMVFRFSPRELGTVITVFEHGNLTSLVQPLMRPDSSI